MITWYVAPAYSSLNFRAISENDAGSRLSCQGLRRVPFGSVHVAKLAAEGRGLVALAEGARLLGIDLSKPVEFRLFSVGGMRVDSEPASAKCKI